MPITPVQAASGNNASSYFGTTPESVTTAADPFPNPNTAANTIVAIGLVPGAAFGGGMASPSIVDTNLNTYTQQFFHTYGNNSGAGCLVSTATGIAAGANTVKLQYTATVFAGGANNDNTILAVEYAGMPTVSLFDHDYVPIFGAAGNNPITVSIVNSLGATISATVGPPLPTPGGIGSINTGIMLMDILVGAVDYYILAFVGQSTGLIVTASTVPFILEKQSSAAYFGYYWDAGAAAVNVAVPYVWMIT